jgi:hypothetical protein
MDEWIMPFKNLIKPHVIITKAIIRKEDTTNLLTGCKQNRFMVNKSSADIELIASKEHN